MVTKALKLFVWQEVRMSKEGYKQWKSHLRPYAMKVVFVPVLRIDIPVEELHTIDSEDKLGKWVAENCGAGIWIVRGMSAGKTKTGFKWVRLAKVKVIKRGDSFTHRVSDHWRLSRYKWFWKGNGMRKDV